MEHIWHILSSQPGTNPWTSSQGGAQVANSPASEDFSSHLRDRIKTSPVCAKWQVTKNATNHKADVNRNEGTLKPIK